MLFNKKPEKKNPKVGSRKSSYDDINDVIAKLEVKPIGPAPKSEVKPAQSAQPAYQGEAKTMQDDLVDLIEEKNNGKNKARNAKADCDVRKDIQRNLADVYVDGNGEIPDLTKLEKCPRSLWKTVSYGIIGFLLLVLVFGGAGFWFFSYLNSRNVFTNENISLKIEPPITLVSGQEAEYQIMITNHEKVNLYNAHLELFYPENFTFSSAEPVPTNKDSNNTWDFSVLKIGETEKIKITGKVFAAINSTQTFRGVLTFKPANLNADFKQEAIVDAKVASSIVKLEITGPENPLANQKVEYVIKYKNLSAEDLADLQLVAEYPASFVFASAEPESNDASNHNLWQIDKLKANAEGVVKIQGDFSALSESGNQDIKFRLQMKHNGDYYPQAEELVATSVVKDQLSLRLIANGSAEDQPINFEDELVYTLNFKNSGQENLSGVKIVARLNSKILDWKSLKNTDKGVVGDGTITWTGREVPKLLKLGPGEEGSVSWSIRVKDASVISDENVGQFTVETYAEAQAKQGTVGTDSIVKSKTIVNTINSNLSLKAGVSYYSEDNVALGTGPITPKVGEKSSYNLKLALANNLHDIKDLKIIVTLPKNVKYIDKENHTVGDLIYNQQANKITWSISKLAKSALNMEASFNVEISPTEADAGKVLILVSEISLTGQDMETGAAISSDLKAITTAFEDPIVGPVSGVVEN